MTYRKQISREELLILVGHHASVQGNWDNDLNAYADISRADLDFVRKRVVKIRRMANGDVRIDLRIHGKPTM